MSDKQVVQCSAKRDLFPGAALLGPVLGPGLSGNQTRVVQCRGEEGHSGKHHAYVQPFPGFADERVEWSDASR